MLYKQILVVDSYSYRKKKQRFLPEAVAPKAINKDEHGILIVSFFKSSRQMIENGNLNIL
jgi:hypothetical protein